MATCNAACLVWCGRTLSVRVDFHLSTKPFWPSAQNDQESLVPGFKYGVFVDFCSLEF